MSLTIVSAQPNKTGQQNCCHFRIQHSQLHKTCYLLSKRYFVNINNLKWMNNNAFYFKFVLKFLLFLLFFTFSLLLAPNNVCNTSWYVAPASYISIQFQNRFHSFACIPDSLYFSIEIFNKGKNFENFDHCYASQNPWDNTRTLLSDSIHRGTLDTK